MNGFLQEMKTFLLKEKKMREIIDKSGILVIASHNFELLKRVCTKIVYLEKGRIKN